MATSSIREATASEIRYAGAVKAAARVFSWFVLVTPGLIPASASATEVRVTFARALAIADGHPLVLTTEAAVKTLAEASKAAPAVDANPTATIAAGTRVTTSGDAGFEGGITVNQSLSVVGSASRSREALVAESSFLRADADARRLERRVAIALAWIELHEAERRAVEQREEVATDERMLALVTKLAEAGERTTADVATAEVQLAATRVRAVAAEAAVVESRAALESELARKRERNEPRPPTLTTEGPLPSVEVPGRDERSRLLDRANELPSVRAKALLARSEWVRADEDAATAANRLGVGVEVRREDFGSVVALANVGVPVPLFDLGARPRASRHAEAQRLEGQTEDERVRARSALALAIHEVDHTAELREVLATRLRPAAERALALRTRQLELGHATLLDVLDARRAAVLARLELTTAEHEEVRARIRLALMAGSLKEAR